jgi:dTDP-glucose 4,6-dehydratase
MVQAREYLLTGGTGFFGKALLRHWAQQERTGKPMANVTLLSRNPQRFISQNPHLIAHPWLHFIQGDICDASSLPYSSAFTHVLHAAADSTLGPQLTPLQRYDQIVKGTRNLLDLAVACGAQRFLLTSSGAVYGSQPTYHENIPEDWHGMPDPLNPTNAYGVAKRAAEHLCALYENEHGLQTVVARCFAFSGPDLPLNVHFAIGNFIRDALWHEEITVAGDGTALRSYLDQSDLAHWLITLLELGLHGEAYNVGSDQAISIADLAILVRDTLAPNKVIRILGTSDAQRPRPKYVPNTDKIRLHLGLHAATSVKESIWSTAQAEKLRIN